MSWMPTDVPPKVSLLSSTWSKLKLVTVEPVMFLCQLAVFTQFGVMQDLIIQKVCLQSEYRWACHDLASHHDANDYVQRESSHWMRYANVAGLLPATVSAIYMGSWCGTYGAKVPMVLATLSFMLSNMVNVIVSVYMDSDVAYVLVGQFVSGLLGGGIGLTMSVMSYISVVSSVQSRTMRIGFLTAMLSFGATVGPFIGGYVLEKTSHAYVFLFLMSINFATIFYVVVRVKNVVPVPETVPEQASERQDVTLPTVPPKTTTPPVTCGNLFSLQNFIATVSTCFRKRPNHQRKYIVLLLLSLAAYFIGVGGEADVAYLFVKDKPLKWDYTMFSYYSAVNQGVRSIALLFGLPVLKQQFNFLDTTTGLLGILSCALSAAFFAFSTTTAMVFCVAIVSSIQGYFVASMRSLLSKLMAKHEHGQMFAFVAVMENFSYLVASLIFNSLYPITRSFFHGTVFVLVAVMEIFPMITVIVLRKPLKPFSTRRDSDYGTLDQT